MMNPIEEIINDIKRVLKSKFALSHHDSLREACNYPYGQRNIRRRQILEECLQLSIAEITINQVKSHINHMNSLLPEAISLFDL